MFDLLLHSQCEFPAQNPLRNGYFPRALVWIAFNVSVNISQGWVLIRKLFARFSRNFSLCIYHPGLDGSRSKLKTRVTLRVSMSGAGGREKGGGGRDDWSLMLTLNTSLTRSVVTWYCLSDRTIRSLHLPQRFSTPFSIPSSHLISSLSLNTGTLTQTLYGGLL